MGNLRVQPNGWCWQASCPLEVLPVWLLWASWWGMAALMEATPQLYITEFMLTCSLLWGAGASPPFFHLPSPPPPPPPPPPSPQPPPFLLSLGFISICPNFAPIRCESWDADKVHADVRVRTCVHVCVYVRTCLCVRVRMCACVCACMPSRVSTRRGVGWVRWGWGLSVPVGVSEQEQCLAT